MSPFGLHVYHNPFPPVCQGGLCQFVDWHMGGHATLRVLAMRGALMYRGATSLVGVDTIVVLCSGVTYTKYCPTLSLMLSWLVVT